MDLTELCEFVEKAKQIRGVSDVEVSMGITVDYQFRDYDAVDHDSLHELELTLLDKYPVAFSCHLGYGAKEE